VRIGRNPLNDLQLDYGFVSQFHAVLEEVNGRLMLRDLGSTNGTRVRTGRVPSNQVVDLAEHGFEFAILPVMLRTYTVQVEQPAHAGPRMPLAAATAMFRMSSMNIERVAAADVQSFGPRIARLAPAYQAAERAERALIDQIATAFAELQPSAREAFAAELVRQYPRLESEAEYGALLARYGLRTEKDTSGPPRELVFQAVREMAVNYLPKLGAPRTAEELATFISKVNETLEVFLKCFVQLRNGHRQFEADLGLRRPQRNPLDPRESIESAQDAQELSARLLDFRDNSFEASGAVESVFADIMIHQVALLNGVMTGLKSLLHDIAPAEIERLANDPRHKTGVFGNQHKTLWNIYQQRHADLAEDEQRLFRVMFGREFGEAWTRASMRPGPKEPK
jgi:type VI secretion system protein ImpI